MAFAAQERQPGVMVDFTHPSTLYDNIRAAIAYGIRPVAHHWVKSNANL